MSKFLWYTRGDAERNTQQHFFWEAYCNIHWFCVTSHMLSLQVFWHTLTMVSAHRKLV